MNREISKLLQEVESLLALAEKVQSDNLPTEERDKFLAELNGRYHTWYRSALQQFDVKVYLNERRKFEQEYEGTGLTAKILRFLTSGLTPNPLYVPDNSLGMSPWAFTYTYCFREPITKQCNILAALCSDEASNGSPNELGWNSTTARIFKIFIDKAEGAKTNIEKKITYEYLAMFLIGAIEGLTIIGHDERGASDEIDLWVSNTSSDPFWHNQIGDPFIVECKNWGKPVGSPEVRSLRTIMDDKNIQFALLLSKCGVTGNDRHDAVDHIQKAFKEKKYIVVIDHQDLLSMSNGTHPSKMIKDKLYDLFIRS